MTVTERKARRQLRCTKRDLTRTIASVKGAGVQVAAVKVEPDGTIHIIAGAPDEPARRRGSDDKFQDIAEVL